MFSPRGVYGDRYREPAFRVHCGIRRLDRLSLDILTGDIITARGTKDHYEYQNQVSHKLCFYSQRKTCNRPNSCRISLIPFGSGVSVWRYSVRPSLVLALLGRAKI